MMHGQKNTKSNMTNRI